MNVLLDLLDAGNSGPVQCATLLTLVCGLLDNPSNTRVSNSPSGLCGRANAHRDPGRHLKYSMASRLSLRCLNAVIPPAR